MVFVGGPVPAAFESSEMWENDKMAEMEEKVIEQLSEVLPEGTQIYTEVEIFENGKVEFEKEVVVTKIPKCPF